MGNKNWFCSSHSKESDEEMETDQTSEGSQSFVAHVPVPSQKEVSVSTLVVLVYHCIEQGCQ